MQENYSAADSEEEETYSEEEYDEDDRYGILI